MANLVNRRLVANALAVLALGGIGAYTASTCLIKNASAESRSAEPHRVFGGGPAFKSLRLHSSENVNDNTKRLRFELPGGESSITGLGLTYEPGFVDLLVKRYPNGKASTHLHSLKPGDNLFILASIPGFNWTPNKFSHVYLIAGGAGITPIYQLAQGILDNPADKTKITVIFGVNTEKDMLLRAEFDAYQRAHPDRIDVHYTVSRPGSEFRPAPNVRSGYVTREVLAEVMGGPDEADTKIFVCGPPAMEKALVGGGFGQGQPGILQQLGYSKDRIHRF